MRIVKSILIYIVLDGMIHYRYGFYIMCLISLNEKREFNHIKHILINVYYLPVTIMQIAHALFNVSFVIFNKLIIIVFIFQTNDRCEGHFDVQHYTYICHSIL